ncbi:MAG: S1 RNA-binding domain-containing protein, partial [Kangiellaceae bacterium]|nr:S1 RNA-binding domain-containing protein [Kangiellaceae bacterium]
IALGLKQCIANPWSEFAGKFNKNDKVTGNIKSITDFGIFIGLDGGIDGLVHLSDISWSLTGEEAVREFNKGDEVEAVVLSVDAERERISLGIKQVDSDPFAQFIAENAKGTIVTGTVISADAKGVKVSLGENIEGYLRASEISEERVEDASKHFKEGDTVEAKFTAVDKKNRGITLSIKAKYKQEEAEAVAEFSKGDDGSSSGTLGDLLKEQMDQD